MASYVLWCWSVYVTPVLQPPATVCVTFKQRDAAVMRLDNEGLKLVCDWLNGRKYTCLLSLTDKVSCFKSLGRVTKKNNLWGGEGQVKYLVQCPLTSFFVFANWKGKRSHFASGNKKNQLCITMVMEIISRKRHFSEPDRAEPDGAEQQLLVLHRALGWSPSCQLAVIKNRTLHCSELIREHNNH